MHNSLKKQKVLSQQKIKNKKLNRPKQNFHAFDFFTCRGPIKWQGKTISLEILHKNCGINNRPS